MIASNTVRGTALSGIALRGPFPPNPEGAPKITISKNTLKGNDFTGLAAPEFGDVRLDESTSNNRVVVQEGDVVSDVGTANTVFTKPAL